MDGCVVACDDVTILAMSTSTSNQVLSLRQNAARGVVSVYETREFTKRIRVDHRRRGHRHRATRGGVEHPQGDLNRLPIEVRRQATTKDGAADRAPRRT